MRRGKAEQGFGWCGEHLCCAFDLCGNERGGPLDSGGLAPEGAAEASTCVPSTKSAFSSAPHLSASQLRVLGAIAAAGGAPLTKDQLAELAACSKKTVDRAISRFSREGLVEVRPRYASNGGQLANEYAITSFHVQKPSSSLATVDVGVRSDLRAQKRAAP